MSQHLQFHPPRKAIVANIPGGMARQFRVQYQLHGDHHWQKYATFGSRESAEECLNRLDTMGYPARLLVFRTTPVAA